MNNPIAPQPVIEINIYEDRVKQGVQNVRRVAEQLQRKREMYRDGLENDSQYSSLKEELDEKRRALNARKKELERTALASLKQEIKELSEEKKEEQLTLGDWLIDYSLSTKQSTIEIEGELLTIEKTAKLKRRK